MRAAVLTEVNKPLQILDLEQEGPKAGEVRVQVKAAGVCMSDWHIMNGDWPLPLPMVLGHEAAGIVEELGPGVANVKKGDHVIFSFRPHCGHCRYCSTGHTVLCSGHNDTPRWRMHDGSARLGARNDTKAAGPFPPLIQQGVALVLQSLVSTELSEYITASQIALRVGVCAKTVHDWSRSGTNGFPPAAIPGRGGKPYRWLRADVEAWLKAQQEGSHAAAS